MGITQNVFYQYLLDLGLLIVAGLAQYLHLVPTGTDVFYPLFLLVVGHIIGTVSTASSGVVIQANTAATIANTQATTTSVQPLQPLPLLGVNDPKHG
jgi:hypothetical protein